MNVPEKQTIALPDIVDRHLAEQTGTDTAPDSADTMAAKCVQCIVIAELFLDPRDHEEADRRSGQTNNQGRPDRYKTGSRCNAYQTGNHTSAGSDKCRLFIDNDITEHPRQHCGCGRNCGGYKCMCSQTICCQCRTGIESEPAEQQDKCSQCHHRGVVNLIVCTFIVIPFSKENAECQCRDTGTDVYYVAAGKVYRTDLCQETAVAPDHMCHGIIYHETPQHQKRKQRLEFHSARYRTGNQCRCDDCKHHLKQAEYHVRNALSLYVWLCQGNTLQTKPAEITDHTAVIRSERKRVAEQHPHHDSRCNRDNRCEHRVHSVFPPHQTAVKTRQTRSHKKYKCGTNHNKADIPRIHNSNVLHIQSIRRCYITKGKNRCQF